MGRAVYLGFPYYGRWLLSVARVLIEKHHIGLTELSERMAEVAERYAGGRDGKSLEARPKCEGDGAAVRRNSHIVHAVGKWRSECRTPTRNTASWSCRCVPTAPRIGPRTS
ncbi:hypothetical protein [Mycolicibacterium hippocampi]|uniref:hypothetical protein n=1 Tax=Mycolicibacterium hippocampi TaxID=659824 RepID=UPI003517BCFC